MNNKNFSDYIYCVIIKLCNDFSVYSATPKLDLTVIAWFTL